MRITLCVSSLCVVVTCVWLKTERLLSLLSPSPVHIHKSHTTETETGGTDVALGIEIAAAGDQGTAGGATAETEEGAAGAVLAPTRVTDPHGGIGKNKGDLDDQTVFLCLAVSVSLSLGLSLG